MCQVHFCETLLQQTTPKCVFVRREARQSLDARLLTDRSWVAIRISKIMTYHQKLVYKRTILRLDFDYFLTKGWCSFMYSLPYTRLDEPFFWITFPCDFTDDDLKLAHVDLYAVQHCYKLYTEQKLYIAAAAIDRFESAVSGFRHFQKSGERLDPRFIDNGARYMGLEIDGDTPEKRQAAIEKAKKLGIYEHLDLSDLNPQLPNAPYAITLLEPNQPIAIQEFRYDDNDLLFTFVTREEVQKLTDEALHDTNELIRCWKQQEIARWKDRCYMVRRMRNAGVVQVPADVPSCYRFCHDDWTEEMIKHEREHPRSMQ